MFVRVPVKAAYLSTVFICGTDVTSNLQLTF